MLIDVVEAEWTLSDVIGGGFALGLSLLPDKFV